MIEDQFKGGWKMDKAAAVEGSTDEGCAFWTFAAVEERLVEAMLLWKRSPGGGLGPSSGTGYASDAPWQMLTRAVRASAGDVRGMDFARMLLADDEEETRRWQGRERPLPLTRDDVARRDEASEWLRLVAEKDRRLVVLALLSLASGAKRVPWMRLKAAIGVQFGADGLRMRYERALGRVAKGLNARKSATGACQEGNSATQ
jgi:hypothetical protein